MFGERLVWDKYRIHGSERTWLRSARCLQLFANRFDRRSAPLFGRGPIAREISRFGDTGKFFIVAVPAAELLHAILDRVGMNGVGGVRRDFGFAPAAGFVFLLADQFAAIFVDVLPPKNFFSGGSVQIAGDFGWGLFGHRDSTLPRRPQSSEVKAEAKISSRRCENQRCSSRFSCRQQWHKQRN